ncbi:MAG: tetratricopeptide repeat protein [Spirochaetaceae bacterium]|jgi:hypothetical protein|nr:tetratricopeptide repeat protein [Spirochaetaceae bacterium]
MKRQSTLHTALYFARKKKYNKTVSVLIPEILNYQNSWPFCYVLSLASLYTGDIGSARVYAKTAYEINPSETKVLLLLAVLNIKRSDTSRAVNFFLRVLDTDPKNRTAAKGLAVLKKYGGSDELGAWVESGKIKRLYPPFPAQAGGRRRAVAAAAIAIVVAAAGFAVWKSGVYRVWGDKQPQRSGFAETALAADEQQKLVETGGVSRYILTEKEIIAVYEQARDYFNKHRDDAARREINRLLLSNASEGIKNKARLLAAYLEQSGFDTLRDRFSYAEVAADPPLYSGCAVLWNGMAANITIGEGGLSFELLVGYDTRKTLDGRVSVHFAKAQKISDERPLEVLGNIVPAESANGFTIEGIAIHQPPFPAQK